MTVVSLEVKYNPVATDGKIHPYCIERTDTKKIYNIKWNKKKHKTHEGKKVIDTYGLPVSNNYDLSCSCSTLKVETWRPSRMSCHWIWGEDILVRKIQNTNKYQH